MFEAWPLVEANSEVWTTDDKLSDGLFGSRAKLI
jgi:hypothetical protein